MPETLALLDLSLRRSRWLLLAMAASVTTGVIIALSAAPFDPQQSFVIAALFFAILPAAISTIVMFDYGIDGDMGRPDSGCSHWLLRMPVKAWKIAIVPIALKTIWVSALWITAVLTVRQIDPPAEVSLLMPSIGLSAIAVWVLVIAWRPFRSGWRRLLSLSVVMPILYACILFVFLAPHIKQVDWRPLAVIAANLSAVLAYAGGVLVAIHSVKLARVNSDGVIPAVGKVSDDGLGATDTQTRQFRSARHALIHHEWICLAPWARKVILALVVPTVIASVFVPLHIVTVILMFVLFVDYAAVAASRNATPDVQKNGLPPYLAASPLSDATIAWTRMLVPLAISAVVLAFMWVTFLGWACWPENRVTWMTWANERAAAMGQPDDAFAIGLRWSAAIAIGMIAWILCRFAAYNWIGMAGRTWVAITATIVFGMGYFVPVLIALGWFMRQSSWEGTAASALHYASFAPYVVAGLLLVKLISSVAAGVSMVRLQPNPHATVAMIVGIWVAIVLVLATIMHAIIPDARVTLIWTVSITALTVPLSRVLILPNMLSWNRHR